MLKIKKSRLQGLILIALSTYICHANALDTVSSYESSLKHSTQPSHEVDSSRVNQANYNMNELAEQLENRGWKINRENDGTLLLKPKVPSKKNMKKDNSGIEQWQQIQQQFNNAGWSVERDKEGSLRLTPQQKQTINPVKKEVQKDIHKEAQSKNNSFIEIQAELRKKGWNITNNTDGSILLYPPEQASSALLKPCHGSATTIDIDLPVNTWQKAHDVAHGWLQNNFIKNAIVGKIRKIINVYIISIVASTAPHTLQHQIAIRSNDGTVILLN
ncbi:MAG: hypothetical protein KZQ64_04965 [gamma proteobacterium symbiont of Bathyaustriella thionipta]|nr:hypothetical protein [gamma proteobacterium symbiont of Bathyaustriella thionipta]MCU7948504.1 hypothetical protein [gamma proteobacterium symbiont of Bathyaustriella thionipta]MCU7952728.1 hypothetical protein [gamma proteobacterium symbiont of Bathyaustriella thionipta]MCU7957247.1 hypothetical protein [gamma proteobacterium symbiont of Bathyaustriella thionipta]MCU7967363.1 hypothetical protein [gamma proteobacterium symbiont of Bathyaustriella thionipta]